MHLGIRDLSTQNIYRDFTAYVNIPNLNISQNDTSFITIDIKGPTFLNCIHMPGFFKITIKKGNFSYLNTHDNHQPVTVNGLSHSSLTPIECGLKTHYLDPIKNVGPFLFRFYPQRQETLWIKTI